eukprot:5194631-Pleurochrysis_carterae.AAC.1
MKVVNNNKASYFRTARLHRRDRGKEPSGSRRRHALRVINSITRRNRAKTHKCQCENMQMLMNDNQSRNLPSQTDPHGRGSSASIVRPRKFSILPMKTAITLY